MEGKMKNSGKRTVFLLIALLVAAGAGTAMAAFPDKPITIVVNSGVGGGSDILARTLSAANDQAKFIPQTFVVENKVGGSGGIGMAYVAQKRKDPYFMLTAVTNFLTTPLMGQVPINYKDFTPIASLAIDEYMMMVNTNSPFKSIKDIVEAAKKGNVTVGAGQFGSGNSITVHMLQQVAGVKFKYVAFNGAGDTNAALLGGHIDAGMYNPQEGIELYKAGRTRILGIYAEKRMPGLPEIPTMKEQGYNVIYSQYRGFVAPGDIPADARNTLENALRKFYDSPIFKQYAKDNVLNEVWMDGPTFGKYLDEWNVKYRVLLTDMGLIKK
jgi:putative tricarboxylic transport membrane protein